MVQLPLDKLSDEETSSGSDHELDIDLGFLRSPMYERNKEEVKSQNEDLGDNLDKLNPKQSVELVKEPLKIKAWTHYSYSDPVISFRKIRDASLHVHATWNKAYIRFLPVIYFTCQIVKWSSIAVGVLGLLVYMLAFLVNPPLLEFILGQGNYIPQAVLESLISGHKKAVGHLMGCCHSLPVFRKVIEYNYLTWLVNMARDWWTAIFNIFTT